ncbi:MAG TPA: hypothetical protein VFW83_01370, partial [Bryobacteraceae bacterium]|nr:hypothetical protein [Bryobacteraceae bacterium]
MPLVELHLSPAEETGLDRFQDPFELRFDPQPPPESSQLWRESSPEFSPPEIELGEFAGLDLDRTVWSEAASAVASPSEQAAARPAPPSIPEPVSKPMPVTLHGIAPAPGNIMQAFSAALSRTAEIQAPRQSALPLRQVMFFGPAPAAESGAKARVKKAAEEKRTRPVGAGVKAPPAAPAPKPKRPAARVPSLFQEPEREAAPPRSVATPPNSASMDLPALSTSVSASFWSRWPAIARIGLAAGVLVLIGGGVFLASRGSSAVRPGSPGSDIAESGPALAADAGWITDWFKDPAKSELSRHVDVLRGSLILRDFHMDFEGQIENQALGWVFRANGKSFYVEKVQIVKPGLQPEIALVRFAVIDGQEQPRKQIPLAIDAHLDTLYQIRLEALGQRFTTWVQGQKVDEWTDDRISAGGV